MTKARIVMLATLCSALMGSCADGNNSSADNSKLREIADSFVPEDSSDVTVAPGIPWVQVSFNVFRGPLEFAVDTKRFARAKAEGWKLCQQSTQEWTGYEDATVAPKRYTQQKAYVLYKEGVLVLLVGQYHSDREDLAIKAGSASTEKPMQHGTVIARDSTDEEAKEVAESFGLSCSGQ
jgi:hypothetical protein